MKLTKKVTSLLLALLMVVTVFAVPSTVSAATESSTARGVVPAKVRIYPNSYYNYAIEFSYANAGDQIKNIKSSSKNLIAKQTYQHASSNTTDADNNEANIGLYAKKEGKYTVKFDIYSADGTIKRSSHTVTVYAKSDSPVSSIKLDGKNFYDADGYYAYSSTKKKAKLSVKMAKGYTLKKITISTYDKDGNTKSTTVKNNSKITFGEYGYSYAYSYQSSYDSSYYYNYWRKYLNATTTITLTYKDKWTKQEETISYSVSRLSK